MPTTKVVTLYTFDELSDEAKEKARDWWRGCEIEDSDFEFVMDDAAAIAEMLGIELDQHPVKLMSGKTRYDPSIWYNLGYSQSDGAWFDGKYSFKPDAVAKIKDHAPQDAELHRIAQELTDAQLAYEGRLTARINSSHRGGMDFEVDLSGEFDDSVDWKPIAKSITEPLCDFASWIYNQLRAEHEYRMTDENVDENIRINGYTFTESGKRED